MADPRHLRGGSGRDAEGNQKIRIEEEVQLMISKLFDDGKIIRVASLDDEKCELCSV